jgi:hypothetical protein
MHLKGHYQNAYLTHDIDHAMAAIDARYGAIDWLQFEPQMEFRTSDGMRPVHLKAAMGWAHGLNLELIQPISGLEEFYRPFLPEDPGDPTPRFHHIAVRRNDLAEMRAEIEALGLPFAFEGDMPGLMNFVYVDARETFGHFLEFLWATPEGWAMQGWPADKPTG